MADLLNNIGFYNIKKCTGCGACVNICPKDCIKLYYDDFGFLKPQVDNRKCINCGECVNICPALHPIERHNYPIPICYVAWNKDTKIRQESTSGGVFYVLAEYILSLDGIISGVVLDEKLRPYHTVATRKDAIKKMRGSKYLQSDTKFIFRYIKEMLISNRWVLFSGTPCQVVALYSFLGNKKYTKLITCEVICHGVASILVFDWYKEYLEKKESSTIINVNFRSKKYGWPVTAMDLFYSNGKTETIPAEKNIFMKSYYSGLSIRESCTLCDYARLPRIADITIGDYWNALFQDYPRKEIKKGISLILVNNDKAANVISAIKDKIEYRSITLQNATAKNTNIVSLGKIDQRRDDFLLEFSHSDVQYVMKKYFPKTLKNRISALIDEIFPKKMKVFIKRNVGKCTKLL
jgi:coenzyme F420-reducing hydrogenase beta subunit